jgi:hypothetical protein
VSIKEDMPMSNDIQNEKIVYAPGVVGVGRMFMIALKVACEAPEVTVAMPEGMTMFDHTSPSPLSTEGIKGGAKSEIRRFYFRAFQPTERAEIRFALPDGEVVVPVEVWSFEDLRKYRTLKDVLLPRRWPLGEPLPELKERRTVTTQAEIEALKGNPGAAPGEGIRKIVSSKLIDIERIYPKSDKLTIQKRYSIFDKVSSLRIINSNKYESKRSKTIEKQTLSSINKYCVGKLSNISNAKLINLSNVNTNLNQRAMINCDKKNEEYFRLINKKKLIPLKKKYI